MKKYLLQETKTENGVLHLSLMPRSQNDRLIFSAGQYATISFAGYDGKPSPARSFSIASSPNDQQLKFAIKIQGEFTQTLAKLRAGYPVSVMGPFGCFTADSCVGAGVIFLAGGIGVTPFISMIRAASQKQKPIPMTLLYGIKSQDDIPFYSELLQLQKLNPRFRVGFFVSSGPIDKLAGSGAYQGRITSDLIRQVVRGNFNSFSYYICGPKRLMEDLSKSLSDNGVSESQIFTESFSNASKVKINRKNTASSLVYKLAAWSFVAAFIAVGAFDISQAATKYGAQPATQTTTQTSQPSTSNSSDNSQPVAPSTNQDSGTTTPTYTAPSTPTYSVPSTHSYSTPTYTPTYQPPKTMMS